MADPNQVLTQEPAGAEAAYKPISGLAIAGIILAGLFVLVVAVATVAGLIQGAGFFLPTFLMLLPIGGAILSFLAQRQIRASEGTRAGLGLARWGLWLSVFTGLGYTAYYQFTKLAILQQSNAFLMEKDTDSGFFPLLQESGLDGGDDVKLNSAFLLTVPESNRGNVNPQNDKQMTRLFDVPGKQGPGMLTSFRHHYLIAAIRRAGKDCKIEPLGVHEWSFEKGGYKVIRIYRVTTPEAIFKALVPVHSTSDNFGGMRKWYVISAQLNFRVEYTPLGQALKNIHELARIFMQSQWEELILGKSLESLPDNTNWEKVTQGRGPVREIREQFAQVKKGKLPIFNFQMAKGEYLNAWRIVNGKVQFDLFASLSFPGPKDIPGVSAETKITLECQEPVVPSGEERPDPALFPPQPHWKITAFEVVRLTPMGPR